MWWALAIGVVSGFCAICAIRFFDAHIYAEDPYAEARSITLEEDVLG